MPFTKDSDAQRKYLYHMLSSHPKKFAWVKAYGEDTPQSSTKKPLKKLRATSH